MTDQAVPNKIVHLDVEQRRARGRAARKNIGRSAHGEWAPPTGRRDPVELIAGQEITRVPDLLPIRHERMLASPFAFYRGTAGLMAADIARSPTTGLTAFICGDAHASNFGLYASPERRTAVRGSRAGTPSSAALRGRSRPGSPPARS